MKVAITGGTGMVGRALGQALLERGDEVFVLTRGDQRQDGAIRYVKWLGDARPEQELEGIDIFVNLAGVSLNESRWTDKQKEAIYNSRMDATDEVIRMIEALKHKPKLLLNASAIGIYPHSFDTIYTEQSTEQATDFLGKTVTDWEKKAAQAKVYDVRVAYARFGVILAKDAGALPMIKLPYELFVGGTVGSGQQWLSWIHLQDVVGALLHVMDCEQLEGPVNFVTPNAKRMKNFGKTLGYTLNRPHWLPVPSFALKLALGEQSQLVLEGQYVVPEKLLATGYRFQFASLEDAIIDLYNN